MCYYYTILVYILNYVFTCLFLYMGLLRLFCFFLCFDQHLHIFCAGLVLTPRSYGPMQNFDLRNNSTFICPLLLYLPLHTHLIHPPQLWPSSNPPSARSHHNVLRRSSFFHSLFMHQPFLPSDFDASYQILTYKTLQFLIFPCSRIISISHNLVNISHFLAPQHSVVVCHCLHLRTIIFKIVL